MSALGFVSGYKALFLPLTPKSKHVCAGISPNVYVYFSLVPYIFIFPMDGGDCMRFSIVAIQIQKCVHSLFCFVLCVLYYFETLVSVGCT